MRIKVFIENEAGSDQKNIYDEKSLEYKKTVTVSRPYPYPYGFILGTTSGDGDNLDCFVLTEKSLKTGDTIECEVVGMMQQKEDNHEDSNILAVPVGDTFKLDEDLRVKLTEFIEHVFDHLPDKRIEVGDFFDMNEAEQLVRNSLD